MLWREPSVRIEVLQIKVLAPNLFNTATCSSTAMGRNSPSQYLEGNPNRGSFLCNSLIGTICFFCADGKGGWFCLRHGHDSERSLSDCPRARYRQHGFMDGTWGGSLPLAVRLFALATRSISLSIDWFLFWGGREWRRGVDGGGGYSRWNNRTRLCFKLTQ